MPCKDHPNWKWLDEDNECCTACGALRTVEMKPVKLTLAVPPKKIPIEQEAAVAEIVANMERINKLRGNTVSFREIVKRLSLNMSFSTLQKHYARINEGIPMGKRGRKASI